MSIAPREDYFVGVDSDGCALDTMELKHRGVFIPQAIRAFGFEAISELFRETAERVNLYSRYRGASRFETIARCLDSLATLDGLPVEIPDSRPIWDFVVSGRPLTNGQIAAYLEKPDGPVGPTDAEVLNRVLIWSESSNREIATLLKKVTPFPLVRESLMSLQRFANTMIISATPRATLFREWDSAGLMEFVNAVGGQEDGPKGRQLEWALEQEYSPERALLIGDAPGDHTAAVENGMHFFPILPGQEQASWHQFLTVGLHRFREGSFKGEYQDALIREYYRVLDDL